jgi:hypothetical protein
MSSMRSASSKTREETIDRSTCPSYIRSMSLPGVAIKISVR